MRCIASPSAFISWDSIRALLYQDSYLWQKLCVTYLSVCLRTLCLTLDVWHQYGYRYFASKANFLRFLGGSRHISEVPSSQSEYWCWWMGWKDCKLQLWRRSCHWLPYWCWGFGLVRRHLCSWETSLPDLPSYRCDILWLPQLNPS